LYKILSILNKKELFFIYLLLIVLSIFALLKISGSSVGIYESFYGQNSKDNNLIFGNPLPVRGDEWLIATPIVLSQIKNDFKCYNENVGFGQNLCFLYHVPTQHWSTFFKPFNWPYFILPSENAFAFSWWLRGVMMITAVYLLLMTLTKKNYFLSIGTSLIFFFSPFIQWQYTGTFALETIAYGCFITLFLIKIFSFNNLKSLILYSSLLTYFIIGYILMLFPPFAIPLGLFLITFILGYILNNLKLLTGKRLKLYLTACFLITVISTSVVVAYYSSFKEIIDVIVKTSYPGERRIAGGGFSWMRLVSGFFDIQLQDKNTMVPLMLGDNKSEAASFFMFFPFLLPVVLYYMLIDFFKKRKINFILFFVGMYLLVSSLWILIGLPDILSKILLLDFVPHNRMIIGIGTANLIFVAYFLSNFNFYKSREYKIFACFIAISIFLLYIYLGFYLGFYFSSFIKNGFEIFFISIFASFSFFLLLLQKQKLFILTIISYSIISSYNVNPVYKGFLNPFQNSSLSREIQRIESENKNKSRWVAYDSAVLNSYLIANGVNSIGGVQFYPKNEIWRNLDPYGKYYSIYNRYGLVFFSDNFPEKVNFESPQPYILDVKLNPCDKFFDSVNVEYFLFEKDIKVSCLDKIKNIKNRSENVYVYKKKNK